MLSLSLFFLLPLSLAGAAPHAHRDSRSASHRHQARLLSESVVAREVAEERNLARGLRNYTMGEWEEIYGLAEHDEEYRKEVGGLMKRGSYHGRATFYTPGANACGGGPEGVNDNIVALNVGQYGGGGNDVSQYCFKKVTIQYGSKTEQATIVDCCMGCPNGALDFSPGLFTSFADASVGVFYMTWWFSDEGGDGGDSGGSGGGSDPKPSPSPNPSPTPSTTPASKSSSSAASSVSGHANSTSGADAARMTGLGGDATLGATAKWDLQGGNLDGVNQVVMALGNLVAQVAAQGATFSDK